MAVSTFGQGLTFTYETFLEATPCNTKEVQTRERNSLSCSTTTCKHKLPVKLKSEYIWREDLNILTLPADDLTHLTAVLAVGDASCGTTLLALNFSTATFVSSHVLVLLNFYHFYFLKSLLCAFVKASIGRCQDLQAFAVQMIVPLRLGSLITCDRQHVG